MAVEIFSKEYLQTLPDQQKEQFITQFVDEIRPALVLEAQNGNQLYFHSFSTYRNQSGMSNMYYDARKEIFNLENQPQRNHLAVGASIGMKQIRNSMRMSKEECLSRLEKRFPGCKVVYEEKWIETTQNQASILKTLEKGILIDWS